MEIRRLEPLRKHPVLEPGWYTQPWYVLDDNLEAAADELGRIRRLGFDNVAVTCDSGAPPPGLDRLMATARSLRMRVAQGLTIDGAVTREATTALRAAVAGGSKRSIEAAFRVAPVPSGRPRYVRLDEAFADQRKTLLGTALLYILPATPVVGHRARNRSLRTMNTLRRRFGALRGGRIAPLSIPGDDALAWARRRPDCEPILLLANLSEEERIITIDAEELSDAIGADVEHASLRALTGEPDLPRLRYPIPESGRFDLSLVPLGYALFSIPLRALAEPTDRAA